MKYKARMNRILSILFILSLCTIFDLKGAYAQLKCTDLFKVFKQLSIIIENKDPANLKTLEEEELKKFKVDIEALRKTVQRIQTNGALPLKSSEFELLYSNPLIFETYRDQILSVLSIRNINRDIERYTQSARFLQGYRHLVLQDVATSITLPRNYRGDVTLNFSKVENMEIPAGVNRLNLRGAKEVKNITFLNQARAPHDFANIDMSSAVRVVNVTFPAEMPKGSIFLGSAIELTNVKFPKLLETVYLNEFSSYKNELKDVQLSSLTLGIVSLNGVTIPRGIRSLELPLLETLPDNYVFQRSIKFLSLRKVQTLNTLDLSRHDDLFLSMRELSSVGLLILPQKMHSLYLPNLSSIESVVMPKHVEETLNLGITTFTGDFVVPSPSDPNGFVTISLNQLQSAKGVVFPPLVLNLSLGNLRSLSGFYGPKAVIAGFFIGRIPIATDADTNALLRRLPIIRGYHFNVSTFKMAYQEGLRINSAVQSSDRFPRIKDANDSETQELINSEAVEIYWERFLKKLREEDSVSTRP